MIALLLLACGQGGPADTDAHDSALEADAFADAVISYTPGADGGYGADRLPDVVLGPPDGNAEGTPSLDVLSLGTGGEIVLQFDAPAMDVEGADLLVFENPMPAWSETGQVSVSVDGTTWAEFPCDPASEGQPGCAGIGVVYGGPDGADPTDPDAAGGDAFDFADLGIDAIRFVRIRDTGQNPAGGTTSGFDLDAIAAVSGG